MQLRIAMALAGGAALAVAGPAGAVDEIVTARGWTHVDYAESDECRAEVRGNGQFYRIAADGLRPGEIVRLRIDNADLRPIEYRVAAGADGAVRNFYVPFVWHLEGGVVRVSLASETCALRLAFPWARRRL